MVNNRGFSLIELMVALAIMSFTLLIATQGYSFFMQRWQHELGEFDSIMKQAKNLALVEQVLKGTYPFVIRNEQEEPMLYFEGDKDGMVAVTTKALYKDGTPTVFRFSIEQKEDFTYSLVYEESKANKQRAFTHNNQAIDFERKLLLLTDVDFIEFSYFGYENRESRNDLGNKVWWSTFNSLNRLIMPEQVNIKFGKNGTEQSIDIPISQLEPGAMVLFYDTF